MPRANDTATTRPHRLAAALVLALAAGALAGPAAAAPPPPPAGSWSPAAPLIAQQAGGHTATPLPDGRVLVAGGASATTDTELYDPRTASWSAGGCLARLRTNHVAVTLADGRVLVAGGRCANTRLATAELYDPATGALAPTGVMTTPRQGPVATLLADGRVLIVGGALNASTEIYDPAAIDPATGLKGRFTATGSLHAIVVTAGTLTRLQDGRVLYAGGSPGGGGPFTTAAAEVYDPGTGAWTPTGAMLQSRGGHVATLLPSGRVLVAGGLRVEFPSFAETFLETAELYDPVSGTWQATGSMSTPRDLAAGVMLAGGKVLVAGGRSSRLVSEITAELYDVASGTWAPTATSPDAVHVNARALRLLDGRVFLTSGGSDSAPQIYDPVSGAWTVPAQGTFSRVDGSATLLHDGRVFVRGGASECTGDVYDPATNTWAAFGGSVNGRQGASATVLGNGTVLLAGGTDSAGNALSSAELYDPASGFTTPTGDLAVARSGHTATLLASGKVLVAGGVGVGGAPLASAELYDPTSRTWGPAGTLGARSGHTASLLPGGDVLVAGGVGADGTPTDSTQRFDPAANAWSPAAPLPGARSAHSATSLADGSVLVAGGSGAGGAPLASAAVYAPDGSWHSLPALATARTGHSATLLAGGNILVAGGTGADGAVLLSSEVYDAGAGTWRATDELTHSRAGHTATALSDGRVLVVGGAGDASTEIYDPVEPPAGSFLATAPPRFPRQGHSETLLPNGKVLVVGGVDAPQRAEIFNPLSARWSPAASPHGPHAGHAAVLLADGRVLVAGGATSAAEIYDPARNLWTSTGSMGVVRTRPAAALLGDGRVLVVGGDSQFSTTAETYDPATGSWTAAPDSGLSRGAQSTAVALSGAGCAPHCGKVLLVGGPQAHGAVPQPPTLLELFDPVTNTFSSAGTTADDRIDPTATVLLDGRVLIAGGIFTATAELVDAARPGTLAAGPLLFARGEGAATLLPDGDVLSLGGLVNGLGLVRLAEVYDPARNRWRSTGRLRVARRQPTAVTLATGPYSACGENCGKALVVGGIASASGAVTVPSAELYTARPRITAVTPSDGPLSGGTEVTITGHGLAAVSRVTFGASEAQSFTPAESSPDTTLTVIAPPHAAGPVEVRVASAGGISAVVDAGRFTYATPPDLPPAAAPVALVVPAVAVGDTNAPSLTSLRLSSHRFRRGRLLPARVSAPAATTRAGTTPVGTTISLRLSEDATVTLSFVRRVPCAPPRQAKTCRRRAAGSARVGARAGTNRVRFQGRLSARRRLAFGRYVVTVTATDPAGHRSKARSASFELVRSSR